MEGPQVMIRKLRRNLSDFGLWLTTKKSMEYLIKPVYHHIVYRIYGINLTKTESVPYDPTGFTFYLLHDKDFKLIEQIEEMEEWLAGRLSGKLKKGGLCVALLRGEEVAGFNLIGFGHCYVPLIEKVLRFKQEEAWSEQITVHKNFRKRGLGTSLRHFVFQELRKRGVRNLYGGTRKDNEPSLRLARKVGFIELVDIHFFKVVGKKYYRRDMISDEISFEN